MLRLLFRALCKPERTLRHSSRRASMAVVCSTLGRSKVIQHIFLTLYLPPSTTMCEYPSTATYRGELPYTVTVGNVSSHPQLPEVERKPISPTHPLFWKSCASPYKVYVVCLCTATTYEIRSVLWFSPSYRTCVYLREGNPESYKSKAKALLRRYYDLRRKKSRRRRRRRKRRERRARESNLVALLWFGIVSLRYECVQYTSSPMLVSRRTSEQTYSKNQIHSVMVCLRVPPLYMLCQYTKRMADTHISKETYVDMSGRVRTRSHAPKTIFSKSRSTTDTSSPTKRVRNAIQLR